MFGLSDLILVSYMKILPVKILYYTSTEMLGVTSSEMYLELLQDAIDSILTAITENQNRYDVGRLIFQQNGVPSRNAVLFQ